MQSQSIDSQSWLIFSNTHAWFPSPEVMIYLVWGCSLDVGILKALVDCGVQSIETIVLEGENNIARGKDDEGYFENCVDSRCKRHQHQ